MFFLNAYLSTLKVRLITHTHLQSTQNKLSKNVYFSQPICSGIDVMPVVKVEPLLERPLNARVFDPQGST